LALAEESQHVVVMSSARVHVLRGQARDVSSVLLAHRVVASDFEAPDRWMPTRCAPLVAVSWPAQSGVAYFPPPRHHAIPAAPALCE